MNRFILSNARNMLINVKGKRSSCSSSLHIIADVELLHKDFNNIQNYEVELPIISVTEIPPPYCNKCNQYVQNKCNFVLFHIDTNDIDLMANPFLNIKCPIFGDVDTKTN